MARIVVVGAGVSGLTTALLLSQEAKHHVTIVAKHMPGDYDIEYASPWAGANYLPTSNASQNLWEKNTWPELERLARDVPEAGIHFQDTHVYNRKKNAGSITSQWLNELLSTNPWFKSVVPDFRVLPTDSQDEINSATAFTSVCINTAIYLPYLLSQCLKNGVVIKRAVLNHVSDAASLHHSGKIPDVVINCTGLLASKLGGVMDENVVPVRGQIVVVRNDPGYMLAMSGTNDGDDEACYIMTRAAGGGTILGGTYEIGKWEAEPDASTARRIMQRAVDVCPALTNGKDIEALSVIRHGVGLRPLRTNGVRIETEKIRGLWVVHNYGHGGWGYQGSYGCSQKVVELVNNVLTTKPKL